MGAKSRVLAAWRKNSRARSIRKIAPVAESLAAKVRSSPERVTLFANIKIQHGELEDALMLVEDGLNRFPKSKTLLGKSGLIHEKLGDYTKALLKYNELVEVGGVTSSAAYRIAKTNEKLGRPQEALAWANTASRKDPTNLNACRFAYSLSAEEPIWRRLEILSRSSELLSSDPTWVAAYVQLSCKMRRYSDALVVYSAAECAISRTAFRYVIEALMCLGQKEEAWETATKYLRAQKGETQDVLPGKLMQELGYWDHSCELHKISYRRAPKNSTAYAIGLSYSRQHKWDEANSWYYSALGSAERDFRTRYDLGLSLERSGKYEEAARQYSRSIENSSIRGYRFYRMISCMVKAGDLQTAVRRIGDLIDTPKAADGSYPGDGEPAEKLEALLNEATQNQLDTLLAYVVVESRGQGLWSLARKAAEAKIARASVHDANDYIELAQILVESGAGVEALEWFLASRIDRDPSLISRTKYEQSPMTKSAIRYSCFRESIEISHDVVLHESNHGQKLTCNVLAILRGMVVDSNYSKVTHYVVLPDRGYLPPDLRSRPNVIAVPRESDLYLKTIARAGILVNNNTFPPYFSRRPGQRYLNTWHGTPLKSMGKDIKTGNFDYRNAARNLLHVTHLALPNEHTRQQLLERYDVASLFTGRVKITGSPRLDIASNITSSDRDKLRERLCVEPDVPVVLYAPTWRGHLGEVEQDFGRVQEVLTTIADLGYHALYRGHPVSVDSSRQDVSGYDVPDDIDTNELLTCVDALVTDYSSIAIDGVATGVPVALYTDDLEEYSKQRGLSLDLNSTGIPRFDSVNGLQSWLDEISSPKKLVDRMDPMYVHEDGNATGRVLQFLAESETRSTPQASNNRTKVLAFEGHFIPNGVTSAAGTMNRTLMSNEVDLHLAIEPTAISPHTNRLEKFTEVTSSCRVLPRIGGSIDSAEERWLIARQHAGHRLSDRQVDIIHAAYVREFQRLYGSASFDAVIGFEGFSLYWSNLMAGSKSKSKIAYLHADMVGEASSRFPYLWNVFQTYRFYDSLACVSSDALEVNRANLKDHTEGLQFVHSPNIIDPERILKLAKDPIDSDLMEFRKRHSHLVVCVGRLSLEKGTDRLLEAFKQAVPEAGSAGLVVVGDGPLRGELEQLCTSYGLEDHVYFTGFQSNPYPLMSICDSLILSSLYEGQGIVILEALALGLSVCSVDIPGPRSILKGGAGLLVDNSIHGIRSGLIQLAEGAVAPCPGYVEDYVADARERAVNLVKK